MEKPCSANQYRYGMQGCEEKVLKPYRLDEKLAPYYLRHTYCTDLQAASFPIDVARRLKRHSNISTTSKVYSHDYPKAFKPLRVHLIIFITVEQNK